MNPSGAFALLKRTIWLTFSVNYSDRKRRVLQELELYRGEREGLIELRVLSLGEWAHHFRVLYRQSELLITIFCDLGRR
jgi:hypothetical protein